MCSRLQYCILTLIFLQVLIHSLGLLPAKHVRLGANVPVVLQPLFVRMAPSALLVPLRVPPVPLANTVHPLARPATIALSVMNVQA